MGEEFKFGDRVWVAGSKPGVIAFIGETQFAPGEWAGVILDSPIGKNDGSVNGVRYFSCQALYGIFSKLSNLSHNPSSSSSTDQSQQKQRDSLASNDSGILTSKGSSSDELASATAVQKPVELLQQESNASGIAVNTKATSRPSGLAKPSHHSSSSSLEKPMCITGNKSTAASGSSENILGSGLPANVKNTVNLDRTAINVTNDGGSRNRLQVGSRVVVSGTKRGTLKFLGTTHFAKGEWAGVELDDPQGKNDGAVEGKR